MKKNLLYTLLIFLALASGCAKETVDSSTTVPVPSGTFTGQFRLLHRSTDKVPFDTTSANIVLTLTTPAYTYTVTGDTSTLHAGSYGGYSLNSTEILFTDKTYPTSGVPKKTHLNGLYLYYYDGSTFQMLAYSSDTLSLEYDLKKSTN
jgi:hypothetical protein